MVEWLYIVLWVMVQFRVWGAENAYEPVGMGERYPYVGLFSTAVRHTRDAPMPLENGILS